MKYQCCICKSESELKDLDPCSLTLRTNIDEKEDNQKEQTFYCHLECFRKLINDDGIMYIMEEDFSTLGEIKKEEMEDRQNKGAQAD